MSVSTTTRQPISVRRPSFPQVALAVLAALALFAVLVAISVSHTSAGGTGTQPYGPTGSAPGAVHSGYFRDPATHATIPLPDATPSESTPGPGHK